MPGSLARRAVPVSAGTVPVSVGAGPVSAGTGPVSVGAGLRIAGGVPRGAAAGLGLALTSAATFATSGTFAASLFAAGWSPAAAVTARVAIAAVVLTVPALVQLRGRWHLVPASLGMILWYGGFAVAACQLFYFHAVQRLDVGVALMLEYLGGVLVVGWMWLRHGQRPAPLVVAGAVTAMTGLALVLGITGGVRLDAAGVGWGLGAAIGCAMFFVLSARAHGLPPLVMAWAGMVVGALALAGAALAGAAPLRASTADVQLAGHRTSWLVPLLGISLVAAVVSYVAGISAARVLGPRTASFLGLTEVLFAVLFAWLALGQLPGVMQLVGGVAVLLGVALVRAAESHDGAGSQVGTGELTPSRRDSRPDARA